MQCSGVDVMLGCSCSVHVFMSCVKYRNSVSTDSNNDNSQVYFQEILVEYIIGESMIQQEK